MPVAALQNRREKLKVKKVKTKSIELEQTATCAIELEETEQKDN